MRKAGKTFATSSKHYPSVLRVQMDIAHATRESQPARGKVMRILKGIDELIALKEKGDGWANGVAIGYIKFKARAEVEDGVNYLEYQRDLLLKDATSKMFHTMFFFVNRITAIQPEEEVFNKMIKFYENHTDTHNCPHLFVERTDRLSRQTKLFFRAQNLISENELVIHYVKEGYIQSSNDRPDDDLVNGIRKIMKDFYMDDVSERIKKGKKEKAMSGTFPALAPVGYTNVTLPDGKKVIAPDSHTAPLIKKMFKWLVDENKGQTEIYNLATQSGLVNPRTNKPLSRRTINRILRNPIYAGHINWGGERYDGAHEPLVSIEKFDKAQRRLS
jgi:DNA invertase Pin-like site-specific DNA recombinase